jgi:hypothetical protein
VHDFANELAALKLLLAAIGLADDDEERSRHLGTAKQSLIEGESRLRALREAVRRELAEASSPSVPAMERESATASAKALSKRAAKSAARRIKKRST